MPKKIITPALAVAILPYGVMVLNHCVWRLRFFRIRNEGLNLDSKVLENCKIQRALVFGMAVGNSSILGVILPKGSVTLAVTECVNAVFWVHREFLSALIYQVDITPGHSCKPAVRRAAIHSDERFTLRT